MRIEQAMSALAESLEHPPAESALDLTILLPCLNEAETIGQCVSVARNSLDHLGIPGEVLVADNGSTDGSIEIARGRGARVLNVPTRGYGSALRAGIENARGRWIIMGDSDLSYDFSKIDLFVAKLKEGFELVMGCRLPRGGGTILPGAMPWKHRWIGNPVLSFIGRLFFQSPVTDFHCGLRGFSRDAVKKLGLKTTGMEFASEMVIKSTLRKLKIAEVPIMLHPDGRSRPPHLRSWRDGWRHLRFMLLFSPRWLFVGPGLAMLALGTAAFIPLTLGPVNVGRIQFDTNTLLVAAMLMIAGFQILFFGIFTRLYTLMRGLLPQSRKLSRFLSVFTLERGIVAGLVLLLAGFGFLADAILTWRSVDFGSISYPDSLRLVIPAVTCIVLGVQTIFSSFFLSILDLKHD